MPPAVLIPVGPGAEEEERLDALLASLRAFEPGMRVLAVDDGPAPRELPVESLRTAIWEGDPTPYEAMTAGTLDGLAALAGADWVLKLDTAALVIPPFAAAVG